MLRTPLRLLLLAAGSIVLGATANCQQIPETDRLLVCNKAEHTLSIFSPAERRELAVIETGSGPHEVAVSGDGRTAVVSDYGEQRPGHTLTVIDVRAAKVLRTIDLPQDGDGDKKYLRPHGVQFVGDQRVVVTSEAARRLLLVDVAAGSIERTWPTPQSSMHMVSVTADGRRAAASSIRDGNVVFFDLAAEAVAGDGEGAPPKPVATGDGAEGLAVHPKTGDAWVGNRAADTLTIVRGATGEVAATLPTGRFPFRVAFSPDGSRVLVTCAESGELMVFDSVEQKLVTTVSIQGDVSEQSPLPLGVATDPDSRFAYVACARGEFVAIVDLHEAKVIDRLACRKGPDGIAYARPRAAPIKR
jgi:DNA-binding beta-propeller fold protein YncE